MNERGNVRAARCMPMLLSIRLRKRREQQLTGV
jgi:hypothetical protein